MLGNFSLYFWCLLIIFEKFFKVPYEWQVFCFKIRTDILSSLNRVQNVCEWYQKITKIATRRLGVTVETFCSATEISKNITDFVPTAYSKTCVKRPLYKIPKLVFKTNYRLMQVNRIEECSKGSILQYF